MFWNVCVDDAASKAEKYMYERLMIMADIQSFKCVRPSVELAEKVAALPYDVYNRAEATEVV